MSVTLDVPTPRAGEDERWRHWSMAYAESSRKATRQMRVVLALLGIALVVRVVMMQMVP